MNKIIRSIFVIAIFVLARGEANAEWKPGGGSMLTRWGKEVTPETTHPDYPRPQLVRKEWRNLNGLWDYAITRAEDPKPQRYDGQILVPFPIESALSGVMRRLDEHSVLWYHRTFTIPSDWAGQRVRLNFGAVDWQATIFINGHNVGIHRGGYDAFTLDITDNLRKDNGLQELLIADFDPTEADQPRGKQSSHPEGVFYTPSSGIWQTVWIEPVPSTCIDRLQIVPDIDAGVARLRIESCSAMENCVVEAVASMGGKEVGRVSGSANSEIALPVGTPKLWSPRDPFLYDLQVRLSQSNHLADEVSSYFGMRKVGIRKDEKGVNRIVLNNQFIFPVGILDQGFWPDGLYTAPSDEALQYDINIEKQLGFNLIRKHVKVEPERWYYWCDKKGMLVWQDMPSANNGTDEAKRQFEVELQRMIEGRGNHPSIIMWILFNEGWGQYDTERLTHWVKAIDSTRLVDDASGWTDRRTGDVLDMHSYPGPGAPALDSDRAAILGEFGGLGLGIRGHTWSKQVWGYQGMSDSQRLTRQYDRLLRKVWDLKDSSGLAGVVYTQATDIETECNGLMTYDRAIIKVNPNETAEANENELAPPEYQVVVPDAVQGPVIWSYTTQKPADDWFKPDFEDSTWRQGPGGFGTSGTPGSIVRTEWKTDDIWLRRQFVLKTSELNSPQLHMHHDEDVEVYLNGFLAATDPANISAYAEFDISPEAEASLRKGTNTMAVHCHQTVGGQYVDVGILSVGSSTLPQVKIQ